MCYYISRPNLCQLQNKILCVSAPPGSGKTYTAITEYVIPGIHIGLKWLVVQPTKHLIDDTVKLLLEHCPAAKCRKITSDTHPGHVAQELSEYIEGAEPYVGEVLFITHAVLPHLKWLVKKQNWNLIVDEEPQVIKCLDKRIPDHKELLTDCIALGTPLGTYKLVDIVDRPKLEAIAINKNDDEVSAVLQDVAQVLLNQNYICRLEPEQYRRFLSGQQQSLSIYCELRKSIFDGWASSRFLAANFEDTMTYQLWSNDFSKDLRFISKLRAAPFVDDANIHIHYIHDGYNSKRLNDTFDLEGHAIQAAKDLFRDEEFLVHFNKRPDDKEWWQKHFKETKAEECPRIPHGLQLGSLTSIISCSYRR